MLYITMYASYSLEIVDGKALVSMSMMGEPISGGVLDKENGTIAFEMNSNTDGPSYSDPEYSTGEENRDGSGVLEDENVSVNGDKVAVSSGEMN